VGNILLEGRSPVNGLSQEAAKDPVPCRTMMSKMERIVSVIFFSIKWVFGLENSQM
jgi:hypothetical protein